MPRGDPFSVLCQRVAALAQPVAADLHVHTLSSDGDYTPSQVLAFAQQAKLKAVAITDHDTLAGFDAAPVRDFHVALIPGVELSTRWNGRDTHLLGLGFDPHDGPLRQLLERQCERRRERYRVMQGRLREQGFEVEPPGCAASWGRRHLAQGLVRSGTAKNLHDAFQRFLLPMTVPACEWVDIREAIEVVREAGGIAALAHPGEAIAEEDLAELKTLGMNAMEVAHPSLGASRSVELRKWAANLGLLNTGGSDCHGPNTPAIGTHGLRNDEWQALCEDTTTRRHCSDSEKFRD